MKRYRVLVSCALIVLMPSPSFGTPTVYASSAPTSSIRHIRQLCLDIWTRLDTLAAIRFSHEDLMCAADELIDHLITLRHYIGQLHTDTTCTAESLHSLYHMLHEIAERFELLCVDKSSKEIFCVQVLFERLLQTLETALKNSRSDQTQRVLPTSG